MMPAKPAVCASLGIHYTMLIGNWQLATGNWQLAIDNWQLPSAHDISHAYCELGDVSYGQTTTYHYAVCTLARALLCDEICMLVIIQPVWVWISCWVAVKQKAETVRSWLILHSLLRCFQCYALLFRLPFLKHRPYWLLLDADWFPSAIMTPFTTAGPDHTHIVSMPQHAAAWHGVVH